MAIFKRNKRASWIITIVLLSVILALEANKTAYPMYAYLRSSSVGMSKEQIIAVVASQKKGHLIGAKEFATDNPYLEVTLHYNYYKDIQDRMPRLGGGNGAISTESGSVLLEKSVIRGAVPAA